MLLSTGKIDPAKQRNTNEKITDKARGMFEKATGKNVPDKVCRYSPTPLQMLQCLDTSGLA